jgi:serine protease AprX
MAINKAACFFLFSPLTVLGQSNRYFVSFRDKVNTSYSISQPLQFLSQKSIDRRTRENFGVIDEDLPVDTAYVRQVKATGAEVFFSSRWFNGVLVQTDATVVGAISALPFVSNVELVAYGATLVSDREKARNKFEQAKSGNAQPNQAQLQMIGIDKMQAAGFHGEGIDVAVFDAGFIGVSSLPAFQVLYQSNQVISTFNFVRNIADVYSDDDHGTEVLSIMAGNTASYLGGLYKANYFLYETEDVTTEYRVEEYNWAFAAERADSAGVDVINSSLGYNTFDDPAMNYTYQDLDGKTAISSQAARKAVLRGILVANSAGNDGDDSWMYVDVPADADGVLAAGSVDYSGARSPFSSMGPTYDGRIKPDVDAVGSGAVVITSAGSVSTDDGTSFSTPLIACLAGGLRQSLPNSSSQEIYYRIIKSGSKATQPDDLLGYGIPDFTGAFDLLNFADEYEFYPNPVVLDQLNIIFKNPQGQPLNILVYNAAGQPLLKISDSITWSNNPYPIDFSLFCSGIYFVKVQTPTSLKTEKIVRIN